MLQAGRKSCSEGTFADVFFWVQETEYASCFLKEIKAIKSLFELFVTNVSKSIPEDQTDIAILLTSLSLSLLTMYAISPDCTGPSALICICVGSDCAIFYTNACATFII